jgi:hypothetical protein
MLNIALLLLASGSQAFDFKSYSAEAGISRSFQYIPAANIPNRLAGVKEYHYEGNSGSDFGFRAGFSAGILKDLSLMLSLEYNKTELNLQNLKNELISFNGEPARAVFSNNLDLEYSSFKISLQPEWNIAGTFYLCASTGIIIPVSASYYYSERLVFPADRGSFPNLRRIKNEASGSASNLSPSISFSASPKYGVPLNKEKSLFLQASFMAGYNIAGILEDASLNSISIAPELSIKYIFKQKEEAFIASGENRRDYKLELSVWAEPEEKRKGTLKVDVIRYNVPILNKSFDIPVNKSYNLIFHPAVLREAPLKSLNLSIFAGDSVYKIDALNQDLLYWKFQPVENLPQAIEYKLSGGDIYGNQAESILGNLPMNLNVINEKLPFRNEAIDLSLVSEGNIPEELNKIDSGVIIAVIPVELQVELNENGVLYQKHLKEKAKALETSLKNAFERKNIKFFTIPVAAKHNEFDFSKIYLSFFK